MRSQFISHKGKRSRHTYRELTGNVPSNVVGWESKPSAWATGAMASVGQGVSSA